MHDISDTCLKKNINDLGAIGGQRELKAFVVIVTKNQ